MVPRCELFEDLPREALCQAGHAGDDHDWFEAFGVRVGKLVVLFNCADGFDVLEIERVPLDVLEVAIFHEIHPTCVTLRHVNRLLRHMLQVQDARFNDLLGLQYVLLSCGCRIGVGLSGASVQLSDQVSRVFLNEFLACRGLGQLLICLEHLLEHE